MSKWYDEPRACPGCISPDFAIPDLSDETKELTDCQAQNLARQIGVADWVQSETQPRYEDGTPLVNVDTKEIYEVIGRENCTPQCSHEADWCAILLEDGSYGWTGVDPGDWQNTQQLPPRPELDAGWELTGKVVYINGALDLQDGEYFVDHNNRCQTTTLGLDLAAEVNYCGGWRWIARKVEKRVVNLEAPDDASAESRAEVAAELASDRIGLGYQPDDSPVERDLNKRWEQGIDHHPKSIEMFQILQAADWDYGDEHFCWKSGGDGDNGETLMYALDVFFEIEDQQ